MACVVQSIETRCVEEAQDLLGLYSKSTVEGARSPAPAAHPL